MPEAAGVKFASVARVRKAYEQVYDQLREMILSGRLAEGERLPSEGQLATDFGVSRSTVREALRLLIAEGLIHTEKGSRGGSFVTLPTVEHVSDFLRRNLEILSLSDDITLADFLETREVIEVFAVRLAAQRRSPEDLQALRATLVPAQRSISPQDQYLRNKEFHSVLISACGNALLSVAAQPIFLVLHTHLSRSSLTEDFPRRVCAEHGLILDAIEAGDPDLAEQRMRDHLQELSIVYKGIWHNGSRTVAGA